ncbi:AbrB family transcriptional regulator [Rhodopseudomonas sp. P2A-2r]|uniref:AbrB/MazE/SpoVT family DNA-binding domain-containing protein n=1 Tax=Rhodopseudomonas sp. P2A-2r TaxID=2991972 RepID=UPI0022340BCB|nr:AbrB family transcriptional regulator [Rhodopseudomonas sp. P2A-2r]UZE48815.1 AbrB family transcriptional regulator [Rhodopseudomonas sp. P2A-2r]
MIVSKLGDSLIVRLSDDDVKTLGLKEGDIVQVKPLDVTPARLTDPAERKAALDRLERFRGMMPADLKFNRDEANER